MPLRKAAPAANPAPQPQQQVASLTEFSAGLFDDIDMTIVDIAFCDWDYNGEIATPVLACAIQFQDKNEETYDHYCSTGDPDRSGNRNFEASGDGAFAIPIGSRAMLGKDSNFGVFMSSLLQAGFPADMLADGSVKHLIGTQVHVLRVPAPGSRKGLIRTGRNAEREQTVLTVTKLIALPGAQQAKPAKVGRPTQTASAAPAASRSGLGKGIAASRTNGQAGQATTATASGDNEVDTLAAASLLQVLAEAGGSLVKKEIPPKVLQTLKGNPLKAQVVARVYQDSFLESVAGIQYDGATVTLA